MAAFGFVGFHLPSIRFFAFKDSLRHSWVSSWPHLLRLTSFSLATTVDCRYLLATIPRLFYYEKIHSNTICSRTFAPRNSDVGPCPRLRLVLGTQYFRALVFLSDLKYSAQHPCFNYFVISPIWLYLRFPSSSSRHEMLLKDIA